MHLHDSLFPKVAYFDLPLEIWFAKSTNLGVWATPQIQSFPFAIVQSVGKCKSNYYVQQQ